MLFTTDQINELLQEIDLQTVYLVGRNLGADVLNQDQRNLLKDFGIDIEIFNIDYPPYLQAFLWGRLAVLLSEFQGRQVTYQDFMQYLKSVDFEPLTKREKIEYEIARKQTYHHIVSFGERVKSGVNDIIINEDNATRLEQERVLSGEIQRGILERKSLNTIVSNIGRRLNNWSRDWGKIVDTEMQNIYNHGAAASIVQKHGAEQLVYKETYSGACRYCIKLHLTGGIGSEPITFTMNELYANGSNIGLHRDQWRATVGPEHPFCYTADTEVLTDEGWKYFYDVTPEQKYLSVDLDTNNAEWVGAVKHIAYKYEGPIDVFKSQNYSLKTTPNHYHVVNASRKNKNKFESKTVDQLKKDDRFLRTIINYKGDIDGKIKIANYVWARDKFAEFMAYFLSDGNISKTTNTNSHQIKITQSRKKSIHYDTIVQCCESLFKKIWKGKDAIYIPLVDYNNDLIKYFKSFGKCNEKFIPDWLKNSDKVYIQIFLNAYAKCDGHISKPVMRFGVMMKSRTEFFTTSDQLSADLGEMILKIGKTPSYYKQRIKTVKFKNGTYTSNYPIWRIRIKKKPFARFSNIYKGQEHYSGMVYDVELEKYHTLIIRHQNRVLVGHNCRCNIRPVLDAQEWDEKNKRYATVAQQPKVERKSKVKIRIGDKNFEI